MIVRLFLAVSFVIALLSCTAQAYVLTFDDVPTGARGTYYCDTYGINLGSLEFVADHTGSQWGTAHSGNNVLINDPELGCSRLDILFKGQANWNVYSFGAYFSTEQTTILKMVGYAGDIEHPVATAYIGASGASWHNRYVDVVSPSGNINIITLYPVSTDAFDHFCLDDLTVNPVPEPSSLLALFGGLAGVGGFALRRRRK